MAGSTSARVLTKGMCQIDCKLLYTVYYFSVQGSVTIVYVQIANKNMVFHSVSWSLLMWGNLLCCALLCSVVMCCFVPCCVVICFKVELCKNWLISR